MMIFFCRHLFFFLNIIILSSIRRWMLLRAAIRVLHNRIVFICRFIHLFIHSFSFIYSFLLQFGPVCVCVRVFSISRMFNAHEFIFRLCRKLKSVCFCFYLFSSFSFASLVVAFGSFVSTRFTCWGSENSKSSAWEPTLYSSIWGPKCDTKIASLSPSLLLASALSLCMRRLWCRRGSCMYKCVVCLLLLIFRQIIVNFQYLYVYTNDECIF